MEEKEVSDVRNILLSLEKVIKSVQEKCDANKKTIDYIIDTLDSVNNIITKNGNKTDIDETIVKESDEPSVKKILDDKFNMDDDAVLLNRRKELHKNLGSFQEHLTDDTTKVETVEEPPRPPLITPLSKLSISDRENLMKTIYKDALYTTEKILNVGRSDPLFRSKVNEEADRLLAVWMEHH